MDIAQEDQFKASAEDWARSLKINFDALTDVGFTREEASAFLAAHIPTSASALSLAQIGQLLERMLSALPSSDD